MRYIRPVALIPFLLLAACGSIEPPQSTDVNRSPMPKASPASEQARAAPATVTPAPGAVSAPPALEAVTSADLRSARIAGPTCSFALPNGGVVLAATQNNAVVKVGGSVTTFDVPVGDFKAIQMGPTLTTDSLIVTVGVPGAAEGGATLDTSGGPAELTVESAGGTARSYTGEWRCNG